MVVSVYGLNGVGKSTALSQVCDQLGFTYVYQSATTKEKQFQDLLLSSLEPCDKTFRESLSVLLIHRNAFLRYLHSPNREFMVFQGMCDPAVALCASKVFKFPIMRKFKTPSLITHSIYVRSDPVLCYARYLARQQEHKHEVFWDYPTYYKWFLALQKLAKERRSIVVENNDSYGVFRDLLKLELLKLKGSS